MTEAIENWRAVPGFEGWYEVSDVGRVRSLRWHNNRATWERDEPLIMKPTQRYGYLVLGLRGDVTRFVHVLVLQGFVGPRPKGFEASHLNGIKTDNRLTNLCWESPQDNKRRKFAHGTVLAGERNAAAKLKIGTVREIRKRAAACVRTSVIANSLGINETTVRDIIKGRTWRGIQ